MAALNTETVLSVDHITDTLFQFTTTRDRALRFKSGQFVMLGLEINNAPLLRAYSIVSPSYEEYLEFLSIKIPQGALTSILSKINPGHQILVSKKPTGTLVIDALLSGRNLYLLATGTGIAPFMGIARDPETYEKFSRVIIVHSVRNIAELAYRNYLEREILEDSLLQSFICGNFSYYPTVTRETFINNLRIPQLISSGKLVADLSMPAFDPIYDRIMICGNQSMLAETQSLCEAMGFVEGNSSFEGSFVTEKAFAEKKTSA